MKDVNNMNTGFEKLIAYQKSVELSMKIFEISKGFPAGEKYALTDQVRRSSRSVSANISEAYCKRRYKAHFISKLTDANMENSETQVWLHFAWKCNYISEDVHDKLNGITQELGKLINFMILYPEKFS